MVEEAVYSPKTGIHFNISRHSPWSIHLWMVSGLEDESGEHPS